MSKRKKFVLTSFLLSLGFIGIQFLDNPYRIPAIFGLSLFTAGLFAWSLYEGLGLDMTILTMVLPAVFTAGVGLFWFLLPANLYRQKH